MSFFIDFFFDLEEINKEGALSICLSLSRFLYQSTLTVFRTTHIVYYLQKNRYEITGDLDSFNKFDEICYIPVKKDILKFRRCREQRNSSKMVKTFQAYLPPSNRTYSCVHCRAHLASHDELISKVKKSKTL